jgi:hypothetical protein
MMAQPGWAPWACSPMVRLACRLPYLAVSRMPAPGRACIRGFRKAGAVRRPLGLPDELVGE